MRQFEDADEVDSVLSRGRGVRSHGVECFKLFNVGHIDASLPPAMLENLHGSAKA